MRALENNIEIWKDIKGFNGDYQISNFGNVKSLKRSTEKILKPTLNGFGYKTVFLSLKGDKKTITVHILVAIHFLNHTPNGHTLVVNHIDFNRQNNHINNLEIISQRENSNKKHIKSYSQYTGVTFNKRLSKWVANIVINGKQKHLGAFDKEYDAHTYYQEAILAHKKGEDIKVKFREQFSTHINITKSTRSNTWQAFINVNGKRTYVGTFATEQEALNYQTIAIDKFNAGESVIPFTKSYSSSCKGVSWCNKYCKWIARVTIQGKRINIGRFKNEEEACNMHSRALAIIDKYEGDNNKFRKYLEEDKNKT
jgi:hypothetical protein